MKNKHLVLAGDGRQKELFALLKRKEKSVTYINESLSPSKLQKEISESKTVILPLPLTVDGQNLFSDNEETEIPIKDVLNSLSEENKLYAGRIMPDVEKILSEKNIVHTDYLKEESFIIYNAFLTAQGALRLMLENTSEYLPERRILITGFGNVAQAAAKLLCGIGCDVYVAARKKQQRTQAELFGCKAISTDDINGTIYLFDFILNTVPSRLFSEYDISCMKKSSVYIELASAPFGAEYTDFENAKIKFIAGNALPGRFCEKASAKAIFNEIE